MQTLKDEVKNKIIDAAIEEFLDNGYASSSLRTIASQAGITIGNIYSYFSSKEDLFDSVVSPAWEALNSLISLDIPIYDSRDAAGVAEITESIVKVFIANQQRFFILLNGSSGSKHENFRRNIVEFITVRMQNELYPEPRDATVDPLFAKALAASLLEGFITIFSFYGGDEARLARLVNELLYALMGNIRSRLQVGVN